MNFKVGIDAIHFYTPRIYLDLADLAIARQTSVDKFKIGIGQEKMSLIEPFEDIVTMAAEASLPIIKGREDDVGLLLFATESGVDFSKSAGVYLHHLLKLNPNCRVLEVKQACYAATGALLLAKDYVQNHPTKIALVVASDVAWYGFESAGEVTQGAGAIAMIVAHNPRIGVIEEGQAIVANMMDFYRPAYYDVPIVDGKQSIRSYKDLLRSVRPVSPMKYVCFHMPFATMSDKASEVLVQPLSQEVLLATKAFNKEVGNIYNGSLYLSLISLLTTYPSSLEQETIGMFSYGSGATGEMFGLKLVPGYQTQIPKDIFLSSITNRQRVEFSQYQDLMSTYAEKEKALEYEPRLPQNKGHRYVLVAIRSGHRYYEEKLDLL
jgi:hydroxymethylglutaryl-CoA synthase